MVQVTPFTVPLSTQECKWVPANGQGTLQNAPSQVKYESTTA